MKKNQRATAPFLVLPSRIARRLSMWEAASLLGWMHFKAPERTTRRRLKIFEKRCGFTLVWSSCGRGSENWTTLDALVKCGLLSDQGRFSDTVENAMAITLERIAKLEALTRLLAKKKSEMA